MLTLAASATLTNNYGVYLYSPSMGSGAILTNSYGIYINRQALTGVTNAYGIVQAGASDLNRFAGPTTFSNTLSLTAKLTTYNSIATVANGVPAEYATISTTALTRTWPALCFMRCQQRRPLCIECLRS